MTVVGLSAQAIAYGGKDHPWDPSDLQRCLNYIDSWNIDTPTLRKRMAGRSVAWDRLLPEWDKLVSLFRQEIENQGTWWSAPRTCQEMKRILADGVACDSCDSTGRGTECAKCKGTGRRSGGRCRAERCYGGADFCGSCRGRGYADRMARTNQGDAS